jgi:DUF971 family protein
MTKPVPEDIQCIGDFLAVRWSDGVEDFIPMERLRALSPSADNMGEKDLLGRQYGGDGPKEFPGVRVTAWQAVGGYALAFAFSDGHRTGIYSHEYLRSIGDVTRAEDGS